MEWSTFPFWICPISILGMSRLKHMLVRQQYTSWSDCTNKGAKLQKYCFRVMPLKYFLSNVLHLNFCMAPMTTTTDNLAITIAWLFLWNRQTYKIDVCFYCDIKQTNNFRHFKNNIWNIFIFFQIKIVFPYN